MKKPENAPCRYMGWNEITQKDAPMFPAVNCEAKCDTCGWNPAIAAQRTMKRMKDNGGEKA